MSDYFDYGERFANKYRFYAICLSDNVWKIGIGPIDQPRMSHAVLKNNHSPTYIIVGSMPKTKAVKLRDWIMKNYPKAAAEWFEKNNQADDNEFRYFPIDLETRNTELYSNKYYMTREIALLKIISTANLIIDRKTFSPAAH